MGEEKTREQELIEQAKKDHQEEIERAFKEEIRQYLKDIADSQRVIAKEQERIKKINERLQSATLEKAAERSTRVHVSQNGRSDY